MALMLILKQDDAFRVFHGILNVLKIASFSVVELKNLQNPQQTYLLVL